MGAVTSIKTDKLADLANKINVCASKADDYRVTAACHLAEAKAECARQGIAFKEWVKDNIKFSYDEARKLAVCGESDDPAKAIADMRAGATTRKQKQRAVGRHTAGKKPEPIPKACFDKKREIEAELKRLGHPGAEYCRVAIWDAKQSKALGRAAEPTVGWWSAMPCQTDAVEEAFKQAEAAIAAREALPEESIEAARRVYLLACERVEDLDAELAIIVEAFKEIAGKRAGAR